MDEELRDNLPSDIQLMIDRPNSDILAKFRDKLALKLSCEHLIKNLISSRPLE